MVSGPGLLLAAITASLSEQSLGWQPSGLGSFVRVTVKVAAPAGWLAPTSGGRSPARRAAVRTIFWFRTITPFPAVPNNTRFQRSVTSTSAQTVAEDHETLMRVPPTRSLSAPFVRFPLHARALVAGILAFTRRPGSTIHL